MSPRKPPASTTCPLGRGFHMVPDQEIERDPEAAPPPIDYGPLVEAARDVSAWLLDVARSRTDDPLDQAAIDRVARTVDAIAAGRCPDDGAATGEDVLVVLGILVTAFEIDGRMSNLGEIVGALYAAADQHGAPLWRVVRATLAKPGAGDPLARPARRAPVASPATVRIPIVVRRRPCVAHGAGDLGDGRTILVIG